MEYISNILKKIPESAKQIIHSEETHDSDYDMNCNTNITSISNTLNNLWLQSSLHSSHIKTKYNGKEESINNIFSKYVEPLLNDINNPALFQEWKLNLHATSYEK